MHAPRRNAFGEAADASRSSEIPRIVRPYCHRPAQRLTSGATPTVHRPKEHAMPQTLSRRRVMQAAASALALCAAGRSAAQAVPKMRFSSAFTEQDPRADAYKAFGAAMKNDLDFQP